MTINTDDTFEIKAYQIMVYMRISRFLKLKVVIDEIKKPTKLLRMNRYPSSRQLKNKNSMPSVLFLMAYLCYHFIMFVFFHWSQNPKISLQSLIVVVFYIFIYHFNQRFSCGEFFTIVTFSL